MALPHITNSEAGRNRFDPVHVNIFEVKFTVPEILREQFGKDEFLLTEHALKISGLDALDRAPGVGTQKFMGTDRSYIMPKLDATCADLELEFTLNLRNDVDNYIYKLWRAWAALGYNQDTGERKLKREYCADWLLVSIANRAGNIYREIIFKDVMMADALTSGQGELNYETGEAVNMSVKLRSDWWKETQA